MSIITQTPAGQSSVVINGQSLDYIAQQVIQQCPGCPDSLARSVLQNVIREFYMKSTAWREVIGPFEINAGENLISLNPVDQYSQVQFVLDAFVWPNFDNGQTLRWLRPLIRQPFGPGLTTDVQAPYNFYLPTPDTMQLYPNADKAYGKILYVYVALLPVINIARLPNISITHHFDGLFYGTLERLCSMPNKPWTVKDRDQLNDWRRRFRQNVSMARDLANRAWSTADSPVGFPNFAGRYSQQPIRAGGPAW